MRKRWYFAAAVVLVGIGLHPGVAAATSIPIQNYSFEDPTQTSGGSAGSVTDWTVSNAGVYYPTTGDFTPGADGIPGSKIVPDGNQVLYMQGGMGAQAYQFLTSPLSAGTYTVTLWLGQRTDTTTFAPITVELFYGTNGANLVSEQTFGSPGSGQWTEVTFTTPTITPSTPGFGQDLGIAFSAGAGVQSEIDDVTLNFSTIPLPAALSLFAGGLGLIGLFGRRRTRKIRAAA